MWKQEVPNSKTRCPSPKKLLYLPISSSFLTFLLSLFSLSGDVGVRSTIQTAALMEKELPYELPNELPQLVAPFCGVVENAIPRL